MCIRDRFKCAYDCAQLQYTIQHRTVLIISPLTARQSPQLRSYLLKEKGWWQAGSTGQINVIIGPLLREQITTQNTVGQCVSEKHYATIKHKKLSSVTNYLSNTVWRTYHFHCKPQTDTDSSVVLKECYRQCTNKHLICVLTKCL